MMIFNKPARPGLVAGLFVSYVGEKMSDYAKNNCEK